MVIKFAVKDFLEDCEFTNISHHTIRNYRRVIYSFEEYCTMSGIVNLKEISRLTIKGFLNYCKHKKQNNPSTINAKIRILKTFFNYLISEDLLQKDVDLISNIKFAKVDDRLETFNDKHLKQILRYFERQSRNKPYHAYCNKMIIITMISTGMRRGELCNLRWNDVDFENSMVSVFGKKRKLASIPITPKFRKELAVCYLYCKTLFDGKPSDYVFCSSSKEQLKSESIGMIFKRLKKIFNFDDVRLSAHTFRHSIKAGMDSITLQRILRHESLQMT